MHGILSTFLKSSSLPSLASLTELSVIHIQDYKSTTLSTKFSLDQNLKIIGPSVDNTSEVSSHVCTHVPVRRHVPAQEPAQEPAC